MKNLHKKKVKVFGKPVSVLLIAVIAVLGIASAALIPYFGLLTGNVTVTQGLYLDDGTYDVPIEYYVTMTSLESKTHSGLHTLTNDADVNAEVVLTTNCYPTINTNDCVGISTTYSAEVEDDNAEFGAEENKLFSMNLSGTLDDLFAGQGIIYNYSIVDGGTDNGAASIIAVIDLDGGNHLVLFPGWGARTGSESLQYSHNVSFATSDSGNKVVDAVLYDSNWNKLEDTSASYPAWDSAKSILGLTGSELVVEFSIQHQGANTGQIDKLTQMVVSGEEYSFPSITDGVSFTVPAHSSVNFVLTSEFPKMLLPDTYVLNTTVTA